MNCGKCGQAMKEYHGLFEKDLYCDNKECGKPVEQKQADPYTSPSLEKHLENLIKALDYAGGNVAPSLSPQPAPTPNPNAIGGVIFPVDDYVLKSVINCSQGMELDILASLESINIIRGPEETDAQLRERLKMYINS
jgi:hypothetical protein